MMSHIRQAALHLGRPIWLAPTPAHVVPRYRSLAGRSESDVVVVGGGMTGVLVAHRFASAGVAVQLLESARVGRGSTAASSALLLQEPDQGMAELSRRYGPRDSARIWALSREAVREFVRLVRGLEIDCDLIESDAVYFATQREAHARLRHEFELRRRAGLDERWLTAAALERATGIAGLGAIRTRRNAHFNPYAACLGFAQRAIAAGATIFERSPAVRIDRLRHGGVRVHTPNGSIDARRVIVSTGYATPRFRPLAGRFRMYRTYVLATSRLSARERASIGLSNVMVWDTERPYHYARWTPDGRLLLGGGDRLVRGGARRARQFLHATHQLRAEFETLVPALADVEVERSWEGLFAMTPDSLPYIGPHRHYPAHLFALGYGGNGMTFSLLAARILLEQFFGVRAADHSLFRFSRLR